MLALQAHRRGGPEQLVVEDAPIPEPGPSEVLVRVGAGAITFTELGWDQTWTTRDGRDRTPVIPSHEVSGTVAALGDGVRTPAVGEEVYGLIDFDRNGAAAQFVTVPAEHLARKPARVSHAEAAALPLAALTVWQALVEHADLRAGQAVLILGGAGGVGVYGVQIAKLLGARVLATARNEDRDFVTALGAHEFVNATDLETAVKDVDVVLDTVGGETLRRSFGVLRPGGHLVTLGGPPPPGLAEQHGVTATFFIVRPDRTQLERLAGYVDEGSLKPVVSRTFPLADGRAAFESGHGPRPPGKTVLLVDAA